MRVNEGRRRCRMEEHEEEDVDANRIAIYPRARRVYKPPQFYLHPSRRAYNSRRGRIKPFIVLPSGGGRPPTLFPCLLRGVLSSGGDYVRAEPRLFPFVIIGADRTLSVTLGGNVATDDRKRVVLTARTSGRVSAMPSSHVIDLTRCRCSARKPASCLKSF
jgi:hypothetical protein